MAIVKIQSVNRLDNAVDYICQNNKTQNHLITTFDCDKETIVEDFNFISELRKKKHRKDNKKAKMIIQSFYDTDNITPEEAHEIGIKLADNYLKNNHQYIIATHLDTNNIHNHIIFNEVRTDNYLMFDTTRKNTIDNLRIENDKLSKEYNLTIPKEKSHEDKIHYISQRELKVREKGKSFKAKLENAIDEAVSVSDNFDEFIKIMEDLGYKSKKGKHLAFLNNKSNKFMRTKTLGMNYTENSIKYRIENKDFDIQKFKYIVNTKRIDTSQDKFKNNYGLRKWAIKQNLKHIQEISNLVFNENIPLDKIEDIQKTDEEFITEIESTLNKRDNTIYDLERKESAFEDYKNSYELISEYKKATNKKEFKSQNYDKFKKFDNAKKNIYLLKKNYNITSLEELKEYKEKLLEERNILYKDYNNIQKERMKERENERKREDPKKSKDKILR